MLKHRASVVSSVCSIGLGPTTLTNSICSVGQLILEQHSKCFERFIYHAETDNASSKAETVPEITNSLLLDWVACQHEMHLTHPARISVVIEMLILNDVCREHPEADRLSAFVVEQWTITYSANSLKETQGDHMMSLQKEIEGYFVSSPLSFWLREHFQSKRLRLFHRICSTETVSPQLGVPFSTTFDQLCSSTPYVHAEARPLKVDVGRCSYDISTTVDKRCRSSESKLTRSFTPLPVNPSGLLQLTVVTPERMPTSRPECPLCMVRTLDRTEGNHLEAFWPRVYYDSPDKSTGLSNPPTTPAPHISKKSSHLIDSPSFLDLSPAVAYTETVRSPVVLMTNVQQNLFSDYSISSRYDNGFPSVACFELSNDSDTSTLTKKSRTMHPNETPPISLESPPRKQLRRTSKDKGSTSHVLEHGNATEPHEVEHAQTGSIDRVISEFTQLNMEQEILQSCDPHFQASFFIQPDDPHLSSVDSLNDTSWTRSSTKKREHASNVNLSAVGIPSSSNPPIHGHLPRERRRNATSTCIPAWPSSSAAAHRHGMPFFNRRTGLPLQSSPVPLKRSTSGRFDFDSSLCPLKSSKSSACMLHNCGPSYALEPSLCPSDLPVRCSHQQCSSTSMPPASQPTTSCVQLRRRPASLRLNLPTTEGAGDRSLRRRNCAPEVDQAEISCSAPPSGNRKSAYSLSTRLANTLACTPASHCSSQHLLVNFEESMLNGRIHPSGQVDGFTLELGASGSFFPTHERIPLKTYFFDLSDDNKPSPYLAYADLCHLRSGKGYHLPSKGSVQLTLFNPNKFVVKMFVIGYDFEDMPPNSQTFLRQRTVYMPIQRAVTDDNWKSSWNEDEMSVTPIQPTRTRKEPAATMSEPFPTPDTSWSTFKRPINESTSLCSQSVSSCSCSSLSSISSICSSASVSSNHTVSSMTSRPDQQVHLRYLVHLRFHTTRSGRLYLHTDLRLIFARERFEFDPRVATYELRSFVDAPTDPRYSPKKWAKKPRRPAAPLVAPSMTS